MVDIWQLRKDGMCSPSDEVVDGGWGWRRIGKCAASRVGECGLDLGSSCFGRWWCGAEASALIPYLMGKAKREGKRKAGPGKSDQKSRRRQRGGSSQEGSKKDRRIEGYKDRKIER